MNGLVAEHGPNGSLFNLIGRFLMSGYFIIPPLFVLFTQVTAAEYIGIFGVSPSLITLRVIAFLAIAGGVSLLTGLWVRFASALLFLLLIAWVCYLLLPVHQAGYNSFLRESTVARNLVGAGGLLLLFIVGGRRYVIPNREPAWLHGGAAEIWIARTGRWLIGGGFLLTAAWRLIGWSCQSLLLDLSNVGVPAFALLVLFGLEAAGGTMVVLGKNHQLGCLLLVLYSLQSLLLVHWFWSPALAGVFAPPLFCSAGEIMTGENPLRQLGLELSYLGMIGALLIYFSCEHPGCCRQGEVKW